MSGSSVPGMRRRVAVLLVAWASVAAAVAGFFLPWAVVDLRTPGRDGASVRDALRGLTQKLGRVEVTIHRGSETVSGELPSADNLPRQVSGIEIPRLANDQKTQVAVALIELLTNTRQPIGVTSYAVYLVPGIALVCGVLLTVLGGRVPAAVIACACAALAGAGFWKALTADPRALVATVSLGPGVWLSLWAYVGLAASAGWCALSRGRVAA